MDTMASAFSPSPSRAHSPPPPPHPDAHMHNIIPRLFIGDFTASQSLNLLQQANIQNVVAAMKQSYVPHPGFRSLRVPIDDTDKTNICEWFDVVGSWIQERLEDTDGRGVLVHCAAGVSRSTTLVAAYLMKAYKLTTDEAVTYIASRRPQVQPTEFFIHQLEMYERCGCEWEPAKHQEQRRFVMGFVANEMKDGAGPGKLVLAYYPSPAPSPHDGHTRDPLLTMTALSLASVDSKLKLPSSLTSPIGGPQAAPARRRLTPRAQPAALPAGRAKAKPSASPTVEKLGEGQVVIRGKRLRCKQCRRELAAREHILLHQPGQGQAAFAPQKRDMVQFREEALEALRARIADEESQRELASGLTSVSTTRAGSPCATPPSGGPGSPEPAGQRPRPVLPLLLKQLSLSSPPLNPHPECSSYFVEPLSWMSGVLETGEMVGKIVCPSNRCGSKLGNFDWAGCQCSCGAWITPGFQISRSKVDEL